MRYFLSVLAFILLPAVALSAETTTSNSPTASTRPANGAEVPLDKPNVDDQTIIIWSAAAVTQVMNFGFRDVQESFVKSQKYFTPDGWKTFLETMAKSRILTDVTRYHQTIQSTIREMPTVRSEGLSKYGVYLWVVDVPILETTSAGNKKLQRKTTITLKIIRTPASQAPTGIGIREWAAK